MGFHEAISVNEFGNTLDLKYGISMNSYEIQLVKLLWASRGCGMMWINYYKNYFEQEQM